MCLGARGVRKDGLLLVRQMCMHSGDHAEPPKHTVRFGRRLDPHPGHPVGRQGPFLVGAKRWVHIFSRVQQPVAPAEQRPAQEVHTHLVFEVAWGDTSTIPGRLFQLRQGRQAPTGKGGQLGRQEFWCFEVTGVSLFAEQNSWRLLPVPYRCSCALQGKVAYISVREGRSVHTKRSQQNLIVVGLAAPPITAHTGLALPPALSCPLRRRQLPVLSLQCLAQFALLVLCGGAGDEWECRRRGQWGRDDYD